MNIVLWISLGISILLYIFFAQYLFPRMLFKIPYDISSSGDRGIINYKEKYGRSIVYEPKFEFRKYISQYILSKRGEKTVVICKLKQKITSIDYDIVLFNSHNKVFRIINIKENVKSDFTATVELPPATSYAAVIINYVDGEQVSVQEKNKLFISVRTGLYAVVICLMACVESFFAKFCFAHIYGDVFVWGFLDSRDGMVITIIIGLAVAVVNLGLMSVHFKFKRGYGGFK